MIVKAKKDGGIALSAAFPKNAYFKKGDILKEGDKGLVLADLQELVKFGLAEVAEGEVAADVVEEPAVVETQEETTELPEFTDKETLEAYAAEKGVELDKRKSLANMLAEFKEKLGA